MSAPNGGPWWVACATWKGRQWVFRFKLAAGEPGGPKPVRIGRIELMTSAQGKKPPPRQVLRLAAEAFHRANPIADQALAGRFLP